MTVTLYHNPSCGTSRNVLALMEGRGIKPHIIEYLKTPLTREELLSLLRKMDVPARALLREKEKLCTELGLHDLSVTDEALLDAMAQNPVLMNRPVVVTPTGGALCRPAERVFALLADKTA